MKKIVVVLVALMVVACSSTSKTDTSKTDTSKSTPANTPAATAGMEPGKVAAGAEAQANQMKAVYFDFDKSVVKSEFREVIQKQAESIKHDKNDVVSVEGNCDERGSAEYNLALGQRRADAVKKLLLASGVRASQIKTTSWGKEKPKLLCHDESCWKENRRVDFVHGV